MTKKRYVFLFLLLRIYCTSQNDRQPWRKPSFETLLFLSHSHTFLSSRSRSMDPLRSIRVRHTHIRAYMHIYTHTRTQRQDFSLADFQIMLSCVRKVQCEKCLRERKKSEIERERKSENAEGRRTRVVSSQDFWKVDRIFVKIVLPSYDRRTERTRTERAREREKIGWLSLLFFSFFFFFFLFCTG